MDVEVFDLEIDDANDREYGRHGLTEAEVRQVLDNEPRFFRNKRYRSAEMVMIGRTYGGRLLTLPMALTDQYGIWRPTTAYDSSRGEAVMY